MSKERHASTLPPHTGLYKFSWKCVSVRPVKVETVLCNKALEGGFVTAAEWITSRKVGASTRPLLSSTRAVYASETTSVPQKVLTLS